MLVIKRKLHFADKKIDKVTVPLDTGAIEEWAYSCCPCLKEIRIPKGCRVEDKAFAGSDALERICLYDKKDPDRDLNKAPELLALSVLAWPSATGAAIAAAADDSCFLNWFDEKLKVYLEQDDAAGYSPFLAGGEEDYSDEGREKERFVFEKRLRKTRLIFERLLARSTDEPVYMEYLKRYNPEISFALIKECLSRRSSYEKIYFEYHLQDLADHDMLIKAAGDDVGLRSHIIRRTAENYGLLSCLELDWGQNCQGD